MKNIPRIFIGEDIAPGVNIPVSRETMHYLTRVMRTDACLVFGDGNEYSAKLTPDNKFLHIAVHLNICFQKTQFVTISCT